MSGFILTMLSAVLFGLSPLFVYSITDCGLTTFSANLIRFGGSCILLLIYILIRGKGRNITMLLKDGRTLLNTFLVGSTSAVTALLLTTSYNYIPSGLSTVLHFTYPMIVTVLYVLSKRIRLSFSLILCIVLSFVGVVLVTSDISGEANVLGIVLGLLSAVTFSLHIFLLNNSKIEEYPVDALVFWKCFISAFFSLVMGLISGFGKATAPLSIPSVILFPLAATLAFLFFTYGTEKIGGPAASVLSAFEPITAVIIGVLWLGEPAQSTAIIGIALVIASAIIMTWVTEKSKKTA